MKDIEFFRKNLIAFALVGGVALAGCANGDEGMGEEGFGDDGLGAEMEEAQQGIETQAQELGQRMTAPFSELDANADDQVTQDEFQRYAQQRGMWERWDANADQRIGQDEFNAIGFDQEIGDFDAWDENDDDYLSSDEVWGGLFGAYDDNEDGHWDGDDWDDAGDAGFWDF